MKRYFANRERELDLDVAAQAELRLKLLAFDYLHTADGTEASTQTQVIAPMATASKRRGSSGFSDGSESEDDNSQSSADEEPLEFQRSAKSNNAFVSKARTLAETRRAQTIQLGEQLDSAASAQPTLDVDDTDGLDPEGEFADWQQRERLRVEREHSQMEAAEQEMQQKLEARRKRLRNTTN